MHYFLIIGILLLVLILWRNCENFYPYLYDRINSPTYNNYAPPKTYVDYSSNGVNVYKLGEINLDNNPNKLYNNYLSNLHNAHMDEKINPYNNSCACQKVSN